MSKANKNEKHNAVPRGARDPVVPAHSHRNRAADRDQAPTAASSDAARSTKAEISTGLRWSTP